MSSAAWAIDAFPVYENFAQVASFLPNAIPGVWKKRFDCPISVTDSIAWHDRMF
jgi:hypothetical protein